MKKFPSWIAKRLIQSEEVKIVTSVIDELNLGTVCEKAICPNMNECFSKKRVTFMILGSVCTRSCRFCAIAKGFPGDIDTDEPDRIAKAVEMLGLKHAVITSVTRDDLDDGGAGQFNKTAHRIRERCPDVIIEVLTPDFQGREKPLDKVLNSPIDIFGHNIETVPRLYNRVRPQADYRMSLGVLRRAGKRTITKSGLMVGLGENLQELYDVMADLREAGCEYLTIGQYLKPAKDLLDVCEFIHPEIFEIYREKAFSLGFTDVVSGPFARSSYWEVEYYGKSDFTGIGRGC